MTPFAGQSYWETYSSSVIWQNSQLYVCVKNFALYTNAVQISKGTNYNIKYVIGEYFVCGRGKKVRSFWTMLRLIYRALAGSLPCSQPANYPRVRENCRELDSHAMRYVIFAVLRCSTPLIDNLRCVKARLWVFESRAGINEPYLHGLLFAISFCRPDSYCATLDTNKLLCYSF